MANAWLSVNLKKVAETKRLLLEKSFESSEGKVSFGELYALFTGAVAEIEKLQKELDNVKKQKINKETIK